MPSVDIFPQGRNGEQAAPNLLPPVLRTPSGLAMIELQGSVITDSSDAQDAQSIINVGRLVFPSKDGTVNAHSVDDWDGKRVYLFVGQYQRLTGEVKKLGKPVAVIRRRKATESTQDDSQRDDLEIADIITQKIIFASRPEPVGLETTMEDEG